MKVTGFFQTRLMWMALSVGFLALGACGTSSTADTDTGVSDDAPADVPGDVSATDATTDTGVCAKACVTPQGQFDVSLCGDMGKYECPAGCCVAKFVCAANADCAGRIGQPECLDDRFTCVCDVPNGVCLQGQCTKDAECGTGKMCSQGGCIAPPAASGLHARLLRTALVGKPGQSVDLTVDLGAQAITKSLTPK